MKRLWSKLLRDENGKVSLVPQYVEDYRGQFETNEQDMKDFLGKILEIQMDHVRKIESVRLA